MHDFKAHAESQLRRLAPDAALLAELALDFEQRYRNLADILEISDTAALKADPDALLPHLAVPA